MLEAILTIILMTILMWFGFRRPKNFPPGPNGILAMRQLFTTPQKYFDDLYDNVGDIVGFILPGFKLVILGGVNPIKEVLANEDCQGRPDVCMSRERFPGGGNYGVFFTDGEDWKTQRRFTLYHFRNLGFGKKSHEVVVIEETQELVNDIKNFNEKPFFIGDLLYISNINITWALIGSTRYPHSDERLKCIGKCIRDTLHNITITGGFAILFPFLRHIFPGWTGYTKRLEATATIRHFMEEIIADHKLTRDPDDPRDFIDIYLNELDHGEDADSSFCEMQLQGICMDLLLAGADTGAANLSFAILFLCLRQDLQDQIYQEIATEIGHQKLPTSDDKLKLVQAEAFIMEVLRIRSPTPTFVPHRATKDTTLMGYHIPKDTVLFANAKTMFLDKDKWGDPENFRPDRFITDDGKIKKYEWLISFGKGKRSCLGETLAKMSTFIMFTSLIQNFSFKLCPNAPEPNTEGIPGFTLTPPNFDIIATPRCPPSS